MGRIHKSQSILAKNPTKSSFSNVDLVWIPKVKRGGANKAYIEIAYLPHARVSKLLEGERGDVETLVEWNIQKKLALPKEIKNPSIKNHRNHIWYNMMLLCNSFDMYF
jgi:hypothetical protein